MFADPQQPNHFREWGLRIFLTQDIHHTSNSFIFFFLLFKMLKGLGPPKKILLGRGLRKATPAVGESLGKCFWKGWDRWKQHCCKGAYLVFSYWEHKKRHQKRACEMCTADSHPKLTKRYKCAYIKAGTHHLPASPPPVRKKPKQN